MVGFAIQAGIGLTAGLLGGLLGIGGSTVLIPGMIFYLSYTQGGYTGNDQHLLQAAAMICNVWVAAPAVWAHVRAGALMGHVVKRLIPSAIVGIILGVTVSNMSVFARENGRYLAMGFAGFLVYVVIYNVWKFFRPEKQDDIHAHRNHLSLWKIVGVGLPMGFTAGLLGIGGGALCVPAQQILLRIPLRHAIANSAATIICTAIIGAIYKNITLAEHGFKIADSLRLAIMLIPTAIVGSYLGGKLVHYLPKKVLRIIFILFMAVVICKILTTVTP